ncbi:LOW QUALITY PROTEIN: hypothetical protein Cgig2_017980 [Carnegiea gigantea]|uniref:Uncharacterized protein n=1 Tax=Carnegiea gigantea TaxID=171969 RepID=A0A9Q1Q6A0_9CARY|nr:LOW QUALITY PROTEIN: hypothetical protein Cgig2_017980 [Carnegiea gigantea]
MAERGEGVSVEYGNEPENLLDLKQSPTHNQSSKMLRIRERTEEVASDRKCKLKQAPKATVTKTVQLKHVEFGELVIANAELSIIRAKSWTVLLQHRMCPGGFINLVERLDYEKWSAVMEIGFGAILAVRTRLILKRLARWLLEKYDPWDTSLNLPNGKVLIDKEDVYVTLDLPMGQLEISEGQNLQTDIEFLEQWRRRGGPPIGSMHEVILERGGHGHEFIQTSLRMPYLLALLEIQMTLNLRNVNEIHNYNWCAYVIKCLNDAVSEWKGDKNKFFIGPLLLLMVSTFDQPIPLMCTQLFYLDRVQFRTNKVEKWFPVVINWPTEKVRKRDTDEQLHGEYERGRIIERIDYHNVARLAEADFKVYLQELQEDQPQQGGYDELSMTTATRQQRCPYYPNCNGQLQDAVSVTNDPVQNKNVIDCLSRNDTYYCILEFLEQVDLLESMVREKMQQKKRMGFSPLSFSLGISHEKNHVPHIQ